MSGVGVVFSDQKDVGGTVFVKYFLKIASLPASDMTLFDINASMNGFFRSKLTSGGSVVLEAAYNSSTVNLTINPTTPLSTGLFYYIGTGMGVQRPTANGVFLVGRVTGPGGVTEGKKSTNVNSNWGRNTFTTIIGWGVSLSSSYLPFPNSAGNEVSKLSLYSNPGDLDIVDNFNGTPPGADVSTSGLTALYLCRQTLGSAASMIDSTTNSYHLAAGSQGITVVIDGPYA